ncbi:hypothetical protein ACFZBU_31165 [Embleya sp. NPDC008237]|uniref:hypothetical protein n=1 Tax=Embleya sp. NPDC008237 TaxID=3363978 RepID=UPI0036F0830E
MTPEDGTSAHPSAGIDLHRKLQAYSTAPKDVDELKDPAGRIPAVLAGQVGDAARTP